MGTLLLIRHAQVSVDPTEPSDRWQLTAEGQNAAARLRDRLEMADVAFFYSSPEPKALATARVIADEREVIVVPGLRELDRRPAGWIGRADEYADMVTEILRCPERSVRGCESARAAQDRIVAAIDQIAREAPDPTTAVVSHGIVLTLYVSWLRGLALPDLDLWRRMRFPDAAVVNHEWRTVDLDFGESASGWHSDAGRVDEDRERPSP